MLGMSYSASRGTRTGLGGEAAARGQKSVNEDDGSLFVVGGCAEPLGEAWSDGAAGSGLPPALRHCAALSECSALWLGVGFSGGWGQRVGSGVP